MRMTQFNTLRLPTAEVAADGIERNIVQRYTPRRARGYTVPATRAARCVNNYGTPYTVPGKRAGSTGLKAKWLFTLLTNNS